ncbi:hypothetical protein [Streptomyces sp. NPDC089795]|uniref:hypothetical protein n=1 Tax=Streptomyces sp. NPDC089795 TaxID=3155297 RepID=UPI003444A4DB
MPTDTPSPTDQLLIDRAFRHGFTMSAKLLEVRTSRQLLPSNISGGGLGRCQGSTSRLAPESFDLVLGACIPPERAPDVH